MKKLFFGLILSFIILVLFAPRAFAIQLSITSPPSTLDRSAEFSINVSLTSCAGCSDSYVRGIFYPSGTSYFGYTQDNGGNWSNSPASGCLNYFKVSQSDLQGGSWSGTLKFKPDSSSSFYNGPGEYLFKVARYTASCSSISTSSPDFTIAITGPTPTPSPTPSSTASPTPSPTPTPKPTVTPTPKSSSSPTKTPLASISSSVLGTKDVVASGSDSFSKSPVPKPSTKVLGSSTKNDGNIFLVIFFIIGGALIAAGVGWWAFDKFNSEKLG